MRIGATRRNQRINVLELNVIKVVTNDGYRPAPLFHHDIALLKLESGVRRRGN